MLGRPKKPVGRLEPKEQERYDELIRLREVARMNLHHFKECYSDICEELIAAKPNSQRRRTCNKILVLLDRLDKEIYQAVKEQNRDFSILFLDEDE